MKVTLQELADLVGGTVEGDTSIVITGISGVKEARKGDVTFIANQRYVGLLQETQASAVVVHKGLSNNLPMPAIRVENPDLAFAKIVESIAPKHPKLEPGIHPTAQISESVELGKDVSIQAFAVIREGVKIGDRSVVMPGVFIGEDTTIGADCLLEPQVTIRQRIAIGNRVIIHTGTVIGCDGFGFSTVEGVHHKIPQIGTVEIHDDVEIGANVTIDRARFDTTIIGRGTKIDNLVQIAHNVVIGEHSIIVAQTGISGSTVIGKNVILAGQSGVIGHIDIGDNVIAAARAGVTKDVPSNTRVSGFPALPHEKEMKLQACVRKLPELIATVKKLEEELTTLRKEQDEGE
ncbi:UDP-3-O-(3-hydroxymyristoyl)glucosamine N-acyltransferase [Planctomycetota bacterium]